MRHDPHIAAANAYSRRMGDLEALDAWREQTLDDLLTQELASNRQPDDLMMFVYENTLPSEEAKAWAACASGDDAELGRIVAMQMRAIHAQQSVARARKRLAEIEKEGVTP